MENTIEIKRTCCNKCYEFWAIKHPLMIIVIWLIIIICMALSISELNK